MATLYITEYTRVAIDGRGGMVLAGEEPGFDQAPIAISGPTPPSVVSNITDVFMVHVNRTMGYRGQ